MAPEPELLANKNALLVYEQGVPLPLHLGSAGRIEYQFVEEDRGDGFAAWEKETSASRTLIEVSSRCRDCAGGFRQQALNRFVARALINERPKVLVVVGLWGCTVDLPRIADLMGVPTILLPLTWSQSAENYSDPVKFWVRDALNRCRYVSEELRQFWSGESIEWMPPGKIVPSAGIETLIEEVAGGPSPDYTFNYSIYEFLSRDHPLLAAMQEPDVRHFAGANKVLDVACGAGIFMDLLRQNGVASLGVERDVEVSEYGRGMGLDILTQDALGYLQSTHETFDGLYCSHFIEHLPIDAVQVLLQNLYRCTAAGGVLVMTFPDPESIRSQLLGFWRDPEHVRFYHPELVISLATALGYTLEWSSYDEQPHEVIPFAQSPEALPGLSALELPQEVQNEPGFLESLAMRLGWQSVKRANLAQESMMAWARDVTERMQEQNLYIEQVRLRTDTLWKLNQTWAWNDNVTLRFRRPQ